MPHAPSLVRIQRRDRGANPVTLLQIQSLLQEQISGTIYAGKAYFAGGCVRDYLLQNTALLVQDVDICVELPQGGISMADFIRLKLIGSELSTSPAFGTAKLLCPDFTLEFVATRKEHYHRGSRYPRVQFGSLQDDVLRRDFTINALLMDICSGDIIDLCGLGLQDLANRQIRCVGEAVTKFREDPLRLLRALRFSLRLGFSIEPVTLWAMKTEAAHLSKLSPRLIEIEITKMLEHSSKELVKEALASHGWDKLITV